MKKKKSQATPAGPKKTETGQKVSRTRKPFPRTPIYPLLLIMVAAVAAMMFINTHDSDTLYRLQEQDLFLYTSQFLHEHTDIAGGLLTYAGSYFTQFCFHPWLGSLLLAGWCALLCVLTWRAFRIPSQYVPVVLLPMALILLADFTLGYWIYYMKLHGHLFVAPIGFSLAVALVWLFRRMPGRWRVLPLVFTPVLFYPVAGFYALLATVLMGVAVWRTDDLARPWKAGVAATALLLTAAVPLVYYRYVFCRTSIDDIWTQTLPLFSIGESDYRWQYLPYVLLCLLLLLLAAFAKPQSSAQPADTGGQQDARRPRLQLSTPAVFALHLVAVAAMAWGCWHFWYKDANFHRELKVSESLDKADWQSLLDVVYQSDEEPTRMMVMCKNLAVFKTGQAGNQLFNYREGAKEPTAEIPVRMVQTGGKSVYMHYGIVNFCYRWCMEDGVEYGWKLEYLKDMLRCAVLNGETVMARKYIDILRQTRYYGEWASRYEPMLTNRQLLEKDPELGPILPIMDYPNSVASDRSFMETYLLATLSALRSTNPVCTDLALMASMLQKDIPTFWRAFFPYAQTHAGEHMPRHYQEAAYLYGNLEKHVDISRMPFDKEVVESYKQFMSYAQQCQGMSELEMREAFYPRFGNTFYYNYFLFHGLKTN